MTTRNETVSRLTAHGALFEIRTENVLGDQMDVFACRHRSLAELVHASQRFGEREYLVTEHERISFARHYAMVAGVAGALREEYGVGRGDRVAICAANSPEWIITYWAAVSIGAVVVGMNSWWAAPEVAHGLRLSDPAVLIADEPRRELAGSPGIPVLAIEEDVRALAEQYAGSTLPSDPVDEDEPAVILFTSGTSGSPKGVTHSHRNVLAACWFHLFNDALAAELGAAQSNRRFLLSSPLFHIASLHNLAVPRLAIGDTAVVHTGRFDPERVLRLLERERVTNWGAVPTMLARLLDHPTLAQYDLGSLRALSVNSAPSGPDFKERVRAALPGAGQSLGTSYGLTESATAATVAGADELASDPETVGRPVRTMRVEIRDSDGNRVPDGTEGEIYLRGPMVMLGYWRDPEATAAASAPGGWFRTGDLGTMHDGRLRISSRRSDLILRGGENIYPAEVEQQLESHPAVRECIVLGAPHEDLGQEVAAVVVTADAEVTESDLAEYACNRLARYKVPVRWRITTRELPRNATGKVNRAEVTIP